jgi:hypothetical protein
MQQYSRRLRNGSIVIQSSLQEFGDVVSGVKLEFDKILVADMQNLKKKIVKEIEKVIKDGGRNNQSQWSWSYWERKIGEKDFKPKTGKVNRFDNRFSHRGKSVLRLPVHPLTYMTLRSKRKKPNSGEFALIDTGKYLKSFLVTDSRSKDNVKIDLITSMYSFSQEMENGFSTKYGIVRRPHLRQAIYNFNVDNRDYLKKIGDKLAKKVRDNIKMKGSIK